MKSKFFDNLKAKQIEAEMAYIKKKASCEPATTLITNILD